MSKTLMALKEQKQEALAAMREIVEQVDGEARDMTADEQATFDGYQATVERINASIERHQKLAAEEANAAALRLQADPGHQVRIEGGRNRLEDDPARGFQSFGDFALAVRAAANKARPVYDERLHIGAAPTTYGNEATGADGGYLVPTEFSQMIREHMLGDDAFLPMTDQIPVTGNGMAFPADETTPWGSNGIRAYWEAEGSQATQTKPVLGRRELRLHKLFALVPVTEELTSDAAALSAYLPRKAGQSIDWKTNDALVNGTGAGQPMGIKNSAALVTVAKESAQAADTVVGANVAKMYARMPRESRRTAVWLINDDVLPQLLTMTVGDQPIYVPPQSGFTQAPDGFLFGRPVISTQTCQTVGDAGDIYFVDWMAYASISKALQTATSMHLWFDYDVNAFRAIFRVDGQPWLSSPITPAKGSNSLSPFVTLAART